MSDTPRSLGMLLDGAAATQCVDSSGETIDVRGVDTSSFDTTDGITVNWEHKPGVDEVPVGRVVYFKKIYTAADCETDRQRFYFNECRQTPYIYVICRLHDAAGHAKAKDIAATIRDNVAHGESVQVRWSIEGSTLEKTPDGQIKSCIWRALAATMRPCNKTATSALLSDPNAPDGFPTMNKAEGDDPLRRYIGGSIVVECNPVLEAVPEEMDKSEIRRLAAGLVLRVLSKTMTAGGTGGAPGTLTGGAALQREDIAHRVARVAKEFGTQHSWDRNNLRVFLKSKLPDVDETFLDHFADVADHTKLGKSESDPDDEAMAADVWAAARGYEADLVDLRKRVADVQHPNWEPEVYAVKFRGPEGGFHPAGRFLVHGDRVHHLEDYHGHVSDVAPEGPMDPVTVGRIDAWRRQDHLAVGRDRPREPADSEEPQVTPPATEMKVEQQPLQRPDVFEYMRPGYDRPHVVEFRGGKAALDGAELAPDEVDLIHSNVRDGLASLRYPATMKSEVMDSLMKAEGGDVHAALNYMRDTLGHDHPHVKALTSQLYVDPMTGHGNQFAFNEFKERKAPGTYVTMDLNNFKGINDTYGHPTGNSVLASVGHAFRNASQAVGTGKIFRSGGDEFVAHFPSAEDASAFARHATKHLDAIPPVGGTHRVTSSFGFGTDIDSSDRAVYGAKAQKKHPLTGAAAFPEGRVPHLAHSLLPGQEGTIHLAHPEPPAQHLPAAQSKAA